MRVAIVAAVALLAVGGSSAAPANRLAALGFQSDYSPARLIGENAKAMTLVGIDGIDLTGPGTVSLPTVADRHQLAVAHADGLPGVLLVANWSDKVNDF